VGVNEIEMTTRPQEERDVLPTWEPPIQGKLSKFTPLLGEGDEGRERLKLLRRTVQGDNKDVDSLICGTVIGKRTAKTGERLENAIYYYTRLFRFIFLGEKTAVTDGSRIKVSIFIAAFGASVNVHLHIAKFYCHWSVLVALRCFLCVKERL